MINCTVLNITQIIVILILLTVLLIQNCGKKRRNKLLKGIDMTILEISILILQIVYRYSAMIESIF